MATHLGNICLKYQEEEGTLAVRYIPGRTIVGMEMNGTSERSCPVMGFGMSCVEILSSVLKA
jgi:hypothetical protein